MDPRLFDHGKTNEFASIAIGDTVCFYADETKGFLFCAQSSTAQNEVAVGAGDDPSKPDKIRNQHVILFRICVPNRYKVSKSLARLRERYANEEEETEEKSSLLSQIHQLEKTAETEELANEVEEHRQLGKAVSYGQTVQLKHVFTDKYLHANTNETSATESSNLSVLLLPNNGKTAQFRILPRYKVKSQGDTIRANDLVILESIKSLGQYLHVSRTTFGPASVFPDSLELNLSAVASGFSVFKSRKAALMADAASAIRGGTVIQLFHKEAEAYLVAEGVFDEQLSENGKVIEIHMSATGQCIRRVHLRLRPISVTKSKSMRPSTSAITFWMIEKADKIFDGRPVNWEEGVRLQHYTTRQYLTFTRDNAVSLTNNRNDSGSLFKFSPVVNKSEGIRHKSYVRIQHIDTGFWLADSNLAYERLERFGTNVTANTLKLVNWSKAALRQLKAVDSMMYNDAYDIQVVPLPVVQNANYCAGLLPFLQTFVNMTKLQDERCRSEAWKKQIFQVLQEVTDYMNQNGEPCKLNQKHMRNLHVIDLIVELLKTNADDSEQSRSDSFCRTLQATCYELLETYLQGDSRKNEMYIARNLDFFENQLAQKGAVGLNATHMVTQLIRNNLVLIDMIAEEDIHHYVGIMAKQKHHRYLELLQVLCICNDLAVQDKQIHITQIWLEHFATKGENVLNYLAFGSEIGKRDNNNVWISIDAKRTWMSLVEFCQRHRKDTEYNFLKSQLRLFSLLCKSRNVYSVNTITKKLHLTSLPLAFACIRNDKLPGELRGEFCSIITDIFVDTAGNCSMNDREKLFFQYRDILTPAEVEQLRSQNITSDFRTDSILSNCVPLPQIKELKAWISSFLEANGSMVAADVVRNQFLAKVLLLVYYLADFGYYGDTEDIRKLLHPMVNVMDGRTDLPNHQKDHDAIAKYRNKTRFSHTAQNSAMVSAKYRAMKVVELFFNARFNTRVQRFIQEFKMTLENPREADLAPFLANNIDFRTNPAFHRIACKKMTEIFRETAFFNEEVIDVLLDLTGYHYENVVTQALLLLNQYYTAYENLFHKCVTTKLAVTDKTSQVLTKIDKMMPQLIALKSSKMTPENFEVLMETLQAFSSLDDDITQPHTMNQINLYNHGILDDIFDFISAAQAEIEKNTEGRAANITKKCLKFLRLLSRQHATPQQRIFDRIDIMLGLKGAEAELGELLIEVFTNNMKICLLVQMHHISIMANRYIEHYHPVWLALLGSLLLIDGFPLKRNQSLVVKALMHAPDIMQILTGPDFDERLGFLKATDENDKATFQLKHRYCMVVNLFAICAQGENKSIDSICQCLLQCDDLLHFCSLKQLCYGFRTPFVKYLVWSYLSSTSQQSQASLEKAAGEGWMQKLIDISVKSFTQSIDVIRNAGTSAAEYTRMKPSNLHKSANDANHENKELIHFACEGAVPFIYYFFKNHYNKTFKIDSAQENLIASTLLEFATTIHPFLGSTQKRIEILNTLRVITVVAGITMQLPTELATRKVLARNPPKEKYDAYFAEEFDINDRFDEFAMNVLTAYEGKNTVKAQIGHVSYKPYTDLDADDSLPLGEEFQLLVGLFRKKRGARFAYNVQPVIVHLGHSWNTQGKTENEKFTWERLDIKLLQVVRALVHNEVAKVPADRSKDTELYDKHTDLVLEARKALSTCGIVGATLPHLTRVNSTNVVREVLNLLNILYRDNTIGPEAFVQYVKENNHEAFFTVVQARLYAVEGLIKEHRSLKTHYDRLKRETQSLQTATVAIAAKDSKEVKGLASNLFRILVSAGHGGRVSPGEENGNGDHSSAVSTETVKPAIPQSANTAARINGRMPSQTSDAVKNQSQTARVGSAAMEREKLQPITVKTPTGEKLQLEFPDMPISKEISYVNALFNMLQSLCDMSYTEAQNLMREQTAAHVVNLVAECCRFVGVLSNLDDRKSVIMTTNAYKALCEITRGNQKNQAVVFENKIIDSVHHILLLESFHGCDIKEIADLHLAIAQLLLFLTEENREEAEDGLSSSTIISAINKEAIWSIAEKCYQIEHEKTGNVEIFGFKSAPKSANLEQVGFAYFCLLLRSRDLEHFDSHPFETSVAWEFYAENTMSVELVKDNVLQRIYFHAADRDILRPEIGDRVKWEVDRTNPGKKLRDFMAWVKDISYDMEYQRRIESYSIGRFFVRRWKLINILTIIWSVFLQVIMLFKWDGKDDKVPDWKSAETQLYDDIVQHGFGVVHNILSLCLVFCFFLSNFSGFVSWKRTFGARWRNRMNRLLRTGKREPIPRASHLQIGPLSPHALWYLIFLINSIAGTHMSTAFFSFHMLQVAENNELLSRVIKAVTMNGRSLLWVTILGLILIYIHALIGFLVLQRIIQSNYLLCNSLWSCTLTLVREGLIYKLQRLIYKEKDEGTFQGNILFNLSFFIVILTIGLNVVFGVIVDTFRQLRDAKWMTEQDMHARCFVCGRNGYEFEQKGISFAYHQQHEHDMFAYLFFFVKIDNTIPEQLTALQMYVVDMVRVEDYNFFPVDRAISLDGYTKQDSTLQRDTLMMSQLNTILNKINGEIAAMQRETMTSSQANRNQNYFNDANEDNEENYEVMLRRFYEQTQSELVAGESANAHRPTEQNYSSAMPVSIGGGGGGD